MTLGLGGDGRYFNKQAAQIILKIAAAAGVKKVACLLRTALWLIMALCFVSRSQTVLAASCRSLLAKMPSWLRPRCQH